MDNLKRKQEPEELGQILKKIAPKIDASILTDPEWGVAGQITFKSGNKSYFKYNSLDINRLGASEIAKDKDFANFFIKDMGYKTVPNSKAFFSDEWAEKIGCLSRRIDDAYKYAQEIRFPVIIKQNSGSQGEGVSLVHNKEEFYKAMNVNFKEDRVVLVQQPVVGKDYRIVVLDNKVIVAYERKPLNITGDGKLTIRELVQIKQEEFEKINRGVHLRLDNPRLLSKLRNQNLDLDSVLDKSQKIDLLDNANLSTGGDSLDVTEIIHSTFKELAINLSKDMGLRLCGVDIIIDGDIGKKLESYYILEVNHSPGINHYSKVSKEKQTVIENMYLEILKKIEY